MSSGRFIHRGYRAQGFASRTFALAGGAAGVATDYLTTRLTLIGTSRQRFDIVGISQERLTLRGQSAERITIEGSSP